MIFIKYPYEFNSMYKKKAWISIILIDIGYYNTEIKNNHFKVS
jgi:hypothetical protein